MDRPTDDFDQQMSSLIDGSIRPEAFALLQQQMLEDPAARRRFRAAMRMEANLHAEFEAEASDLQIPFLPVQSARHGFRWPVISAIAAAWALFLVGFFLRSNDPERIATIESQQDAAWSGDVALGQGDSLGRGVIHLEQGVASLRFASGAVASLEAPASIELTDPMRCRISRGKAVFEVPESAVGFIVETPNGYAVDHGTRFAVGLQPEGQQVEFGVLEGRISVHHKNREDSADLETGGMVVLSPGGMSPMNRLGEPSAAQAGDPGLIRLRTNGRETSIVRGDLRSEFLDPTLLMVKKDVPVANEAQIDRLLWAKDRRSLLAFETSSLQGRQAKRARLRLNVVPSGRGYAWLLPEHSIIKVYGIRDSPELEQWDEDGLKWSDAPGSSGESSEIDETETILLGSFEIRRSQLEGPVVFESPELVRFLNDDRTGVVALLLSSESIPQGQGSLVHSFASSHHMTAAGPVLEVEAR